MKSSILKALVLVSAMTFMTASASAQILGDFYSSEGSQSPATAADFNNDGIDVPSSTPVSAFNLLSDATQLSSVTSDDTKLTATVSAGSAYQYASNQYSQSDPLYDDGALTFSSYTLTISGLVADGLAANSTYTLYLQGSYYTSVSSESGDFDLSYSYGSQSGGPVDPTGDSGYGSAQFTFTTGAVPLDSINLTIAKSASNSVPYPAITSFAIVEGAVPEPTTYALLGLGALALVLVSRRAIWKI